MDAPIAEEEFGWALTTFKRSAFRLETRDSYTLSYERAELERFLAGKPTPPPEVNWWRPWLEQIAAQTAAGKRISRVRILAEPPSDYQRWELWAAPWHAEAGEQISYINQSRALELRLPVADDWWLLDDEQLIVMRFTGTGEIDGKTLITDPARVGEMCLWRDLAVRNAIPAECVSAA